MREADWESENDRGNEALPQAIGRAAFAAGLEALLVPSAVGDAANLVVFRANLLRDSSLETL